MKLLWYLISLLTIALILINNPKAAGLGNVVSQGKLFNFTRSTERKLQTLTLAFVASFLILTIALTMNLIQ